MKTDQMMRYKVLGVILSVLPVFIFVKLSFLQFDNQLRSVYINSWESRKTVVEKITPIRGVILDRNGLVIAGNQRTYELTLSPEQVTDPRAVAMMLNVVLGLPVDNLEKEIILAKETDAQKKYLFIDDLLTKEQIDQIQMWKERVQASDDFKTAISLNGIYPKMELLRNYPNGVLLGNVTGYLGQLKSQADTMVGINGVEGFYNDMLTGKVENKEISTIPEDARDTNLNPEGAHLVLTIDLRIQAMIEDVLYEALDRNGSVNGSIVVLDPQNGEILGMASTPQIDPNEYWDYLGQLDADNPYNRAISMPYEVGSVFKPLTVAAALDSGAVDMSFNYTDTGLLQYGGADIYNWMQTVWGPQDLVGCLQHSLNVCMATLSTKYMGEEIFYRYMRNFGIGYPTGVDLQGEVSGFLKTPNVGYWHPSDLAVNSFGQGLTATPLQMAVAISALANDGKIMTPHVVKSIAQSGYQVEIEPRVVSKPIRPETAHQVAEIMAQALEIEASEALVPGYRLAGKTGTGQIPTIGGYEEYETNTSFVGFGPVDDPRFVVYIWFERPKTSIWASEVVPEVFADLVQRLVVIMDLPPDSVRKQLTP